MYAAKMYTKPSDKGKLDVKGIALTRGDSCILTKNLQLATINHIITNPRNAWEGVRLLVNQAISTIKTQDRNMLVRSKKLGANYKYPDRQVHVCVVNKMKARGQIVPSIGDRVHYLIGVGSGGVCAKADCPEYVAEIDYDWYVDAMIFKPMSDILGVLEPDWRSHFESLNKK